jgi:hypothetical protein
LESLTKYWGFYFVATPDSNGVGVRDMQDALEGVTDYHEWISDLSALPPEQRANQNATNILIASKVLRKVLAARIVVFDLFLKLAIKIDGSLQEKHKRIWLLFQLSDELDPRGDSAHPFVRIMRNCLPRASSHALDILIGRLDNIRDTYLSPEQFLCALDEAQGAVTMYRNCFISRADPTVYRSILREVSAVVTKWPFKLVVSGTGVSMSELREAVASGVSKPTGVDLFHDLGMFDTWTKLESFFTNYVPASVWQSDSWVRLQIRIREHLRGR